MDKIRLGFIGSGLVARDLHWPALAKMTDKFEIVGVSSRNVEKARGFAQLCGAANYHTDYHDLLASKDVEAVVIAYPFEMNHLITREALEAGKHVLVEKPLAASMREAKEMVEWEKTVPLVTMTAENFRYHSLFEKARNYIDAGIIGKPHALLYTSISNFDRDRKWLVDSKWRFDCVGGIMLDKEVHYFAMMRMLLGEVKSAIGYAGRAREDIGNTDYVTLHVVFENGAIGTMYDIASVEGYNRNDVVIAGSKGTMLFESDMESLTINESSGNSIRHIMKNDKNESYVREFSDFYDCIRNGKTPKSSFQEGYKDLQLGITALTTNERWDVLSLVLP
jgi:predicted dehydrogenase